ncbi:rhodanese-like domain-containing protein [Lacicoccus qingdaonensis]|uniref:Rhodanese-related sulfurtransferase n=1 Tax=Lacicoccus qingdaonensis TaxID=576118 RepID=A0A1G9CS93_9BACL|nr:rhodanese-like domain-containing protein [Salinicoccus qingdaonensis]SDK54563.1 Rhodanese-related sulfurtransferase [Salinicoccus qingdaonensis]
MDTWLIILIVLVVLIALLLINGLLNMRNVKALPEDEFKQDMRKVQLVDLREKEKFEHGHILGARNIPMMNLSIKMGSLRKDKPIYLYDQTGRLSIRAAKMLKKKGYTDVYMLKNGISKWTGKIKSKNK